MNNYKIIPIDKRLAKALIIKYHYSKSYSYNTKNNFGLLDSDNNLIGVICYGPPHSYPLKSGIAGKTYKNRILELNRLWVDDVAGKNTESWFISNTMKLLKNCDILVSFADPERGHVGIVYQATNWIYTGRKADTTALCLKTAKHHMGGKYGKTKQEMIDQYGKENLEYRTITGKHRYIYILNKKQKKTILKRLKYKQLPYPKKLQT
jgi:hypothetical protein